MRVNRTVFGMMSLLVGCGGGSQKAPKQEAAQQSESAAAEEKPDFKALMAREATGLKEVDAAGAGNAWTARVLAAGPPKVTEAEGIGMLEIPIRGRAPIRCQIFSEDIDAASTMGEVLQRATQSAEVKAVTPWNIEVFRETPTAFIDVLYHANTPRGKAAGELKVALHPASGNPVLCMHDELGYKKTFEQVTASLVDSLQASGKRPTEPGYVEVQTAKIADLPVGFQKRFSEKEAGETKLTTMSSLFLPIAPTNLRLVDSYTIEVIDRNGRLARATSVEAQDGEIDLNVTIERMKGNTYQYRGAAHGKALQGEFKAKDAQGLPSTVSTAQRLARETAKGSAFSFKETAFMPDVDPEKPVDVTYSRSTAERPRLVHLEAGQLKVSGQVDEQGFFEALQTPLGDKTLLMQRAFVRGKM